MTELILSIPLLPMATATVSPFLKLKAEETDKMEAETAPETSDRGELKSCWDIKAISGYLMAWICIIIFLIILKKRLNEKYG
jgi:hypothetical protein